MKRSGENWRKASTKQKILFTCHLRRLVHTHRWHMERNLGFVATFLHFFLFLFIFLDNVEKWRKVETSEDNMKKTRRKRAWGAKALRLWDHSPANIAKHMHNIIIQMAMNWKVFYRPVSTHTQMASHFYCDTKTCTHSDGISWMFAAWNGAKMPSEVTGAFVPSECDVLYIYIYICINIIALQHIARYCTQCSVFRNEE